MPSKRPGRRVWQPMEEGVPNPRLVAGYREMGYQGPIRVWGNDLYQATLIQVEMKVEETGDVWGNVGWLMIKTHTRRPIRDWRHLQQIKNETVGPEREACEIFPAESRLVDTSNEFHLFVLPEGERFPWGYSYREVRTPEEIDVFNAEDKAKGGQGLARQRDWQPGLTTGKEGKG